MTEERMEFKDFDVVLKDETPDKRNRLYLVEVKINVVVPRPDGGVDIVETANTIRINDNTLLSKIMKPIKEQLRTAVHQGRAHQPKTIIEPAKPKLILGMDD